MSKEIGSIGSDNIILESNSTYIDFCANADEILKRKVRLGDNNSDDSDTDDEYETFTSTFLAEQFIRIGKLSSLNNFIQIFVEKFTNYVSNRNWKYRNTKFIYKIKRND